MRSIDGSWRERTRQRSNGRSQWSFSRLSAVNRSPFVAPWADREPRCQRVRTAFASRGAAQPNDRQVHFTLNASEFDVESGAGAFCNENLRSRAW